MKERRIDIILNLLFDRSGSGGGIAAAPLAGKRDLALDSAKGILILMVVYAHCFTEGIAHDFFFSFHMPAFFVISGITGVLSSEHDASLGKAVCKLLRTTGIPFFFFELLGIAQELIRSGFVQSWKGFVFNTVTMRCNNVVDWFLCALFFAKLFSLPAVKLLRKATEKHIADSIYTALSVAMMVAAVFIPKTEPFFWTVLRKTIIANGFISVGFRLSDILRKKMLPAGIAAFLIALFISSFKLGNTGINGLRFDTPVLFLAAALLGSYGIIQIGSLCCWKPLMWLGRNSLIIMGTHIPILLLVRHFAGTTAPTVWHRIADFMIILLLEIPIVWFLQNRAPFLLGKKGNAGHEC